MSMKTACGQLNRTPARRSGVSLIEILIALGILGMIIFPLLRLFQTGRLGTKKAKDDLIASLLARERLEQLRSLPFKRLQGDFMEYGPVFEDTFVEEFIAMDENPILFRTRFSDVLTLEFAEQYPEIYGQFAKKFEEIHGRYYIPYSPGYEKYRRLTEVDEGVDTVNFPSRLKKITVSVFRKGNDSPMVELVTYRAKY